MKRIKVSKIVVEEPKQITLEDINQEFMACDDLLALHMYNEADDNGIRYIDEISQNELEIVYGIADKNTYIDGVDDVPSDEVFRKLTKYYDHHKQPYNIGNYYYMSSMNGFDFTEQQFKLTGEYHEDIDIINDIKYRVDFFDFVFKPITEYSKSVDVLDSLSEYVKVSEAIGVDENEIGKSILGAFKNSDYYKGYIK